jgi:hypothetical protein
VASVVIALVGTGRRSFGCLGSRRMRGTGTIVNSWARLPWSDPRAQEGARRRMLESRLEAYKLLWDSAAITTEEFQAFVAAFIARPDVPDDLKRVALQYVAPPSAAADQVPPEATEKH